MFRTTIKNGLMLLGLGALLCACTVTVGTNSKNKGWTNNSSASSNDTRFKKPSTKERKAEAASVKTQLAYEYIRARDYRASVAAIEEAVRENPQSVDAWLMRAQVYQFLKEYDKAEQSFRQALSLKPDSAEVNNNFGWYLCGVVNRPNEAIAHFDRALADPTYPTPEVGWMNKGICSAKMGQYNMADTYFTRALNMNPTYVFVHKEHARAKLTQGDAAEADRYFRMYQAQIDMLNADDLLLGWRISKALKNSQAAYEYEAQLRAHYPYSDELQTITSGSAK